MRKSTRLLLEPFIAWRERRTATRAARRALAIYQNLRAEHPKLPRMELYELFVRQRNGVDCSEARKFLNRAEESFTSWPTERDLIFRDVVQYLVVSECLMLQDGSTSADLAFVVRHIIPSDL